mmetsp:Transcript_32479/g.71717  ORF Transcript_32479/g.71717 Transcript_32479/m.71717 type:complete len:193 (-) Transcript_32479:694-1272(-)|eukprot:CAMPEP_0202900198 /NCGR_PEP_ID=MMETSP1392-20130828/10336_1 /ASSEMBLY_ACC=CAM_ASM_000868 /TAXON_ID=225041 /ORGANISM="Chlamydomonas chlamydogama, Strain SAG 11-48b" /LENGTH=192 /DNA_ID=CAMNT_0049586539 /DNA_START=68 /DNA_END=646 /DNA_ORIENTATION=+
MLRALSGLRGFAITDGLNVLKASTSSGACFTTVSSSVEAAVGSRDTAKKTVATTKPKSDPTGDRIPRAPSAWNLFVKFNLAEIKADNPQLKGPEVLKAVSEKFKALPENAKQKYEIEAAKRKQEVQVEKQAILAKRQANKKPPSRYNLFVKQEFAAMQSKHPKYSAQQVIAELGHKWKAMSEGDKSKYGKAS